MAPAAAASDAAPPASPTAAASSLVALRAQELRIAAVVASYFVISIALVFVNKVLLTEGTSIPAPLFVTWFQCVVTVGICWACGEMGKKARPGTFFAQFPPLA
jgi:solute carrier family 35 (GDP-fucose transporter), member C1